MKLQTLAIDLCVQPACVNKPRIDWVVCSVPLMLLGAACPWQIRPQQPQRIFSDWIFSDWRARDWKGDFCANLGCHASGVDFLWSHFDCRYFFVLPVSRNELVPGPYFYHLPTIIKLWDQVSCPQCVPGATRQCRNSFPLPAFLAPKPAELNLFSSV